MFPDEIIEILIKYQTDNSELLSDINNNISTIIEKLYSINQNLAEQIKKLILDKNTDNNVEEIMNDSITLRNYIKSVQLLNIENTIPDETLIEVSEELIPPTFDKKVYPYLVADDICPFCNYKMSRHLFHYQRIVNSQLKNEDVMWNRCPACKRLFVLDYEAEEFDFNDTNVVLNEEKYDAIPPIDIYSVIVLSNDDV